DGVDAPSITVVVSTDRNAPTLAAVVDALARQGAGARVVREETIAAARNRALADCATDVIGYVDDDVVVGDGWLAALLDECAGAAGAARRRSTDRRGAVPRRRAAARGRRRAADTHRGGHRATRVGRRDRCARAWRPGDGPRAPPASRREPRGARRWAAGATRA